MIDQKYVVVNKDGKLGSPGDTTFPILKQMDDNNWQLIGTAFFITNTGVFLTAKHVLQDVHNDKGKQTHPIVAFLFPSHGIYQIRRVLKGFLNVPGDVAAGIIDNTNPSGGIFATPFYGLSRKQMKPGDSIFTYAYPETIHSGNDIIFYPKFYDGEIQEHYPDGRDQTMLPNACYQTSMNILGGASGGPVFNSEGTVIGVNSSGYEQHDESPISFISDINAFFNIILEDIKLPCGYRQQCTIEEVSQLGYVATD